MPKIKRPKTRNLGLITVVIIAILVAVAASQRPAPAVELTTVTVTTQDVVEEVSTDGNIIGQATAEISAPSQSKFVEVRVGLGQAVEVGETLGVVEANVGLDVEKQYLTTPIAGIVTAKNFGVGELASAGLPAFKVVDTRGYLLELSVNENDVHRLKVGQEVAIQIPALSLETDYVGSVKRIAPAPENDTGPVTYQVLTQPAKMPKAAKLGMSVAATITTDIAPGVLAIPESYLIEQNGQLVVKKLIDDSDPANPQITEAPVLIGLRTDTYVEITAGLTEGDVIVEPSFEARTGFGFF